MAKHISLEGKTKAQMRAASPRVLKFFTKPESNELWAVDSLGNEFVMQVPGSVTSVFGRIGAVMAASGDYSASQITNNSLVTGADVKAALEWLLNNMAPLDINGKVPIIYLPEAVLGAVNYQGTWNAATNDPVLTDGTGEKGWYYVVETAGTQNLGSGAITYTIGDWVIHNGFFWERVDGVDAVTSVAGKQGAVTLEIEDIIGLSAQIARIPQPIPMVADSTAIGGHRLVHIQSSGLAVVADSTLGLEAHAFTFAAVGAGQPFEGFPMGAFNGFTGLTVGSDYFLGAAGLPVLTPPQPPTHQILQHIGRASAADTMAVAVSLGIRF
jgi:hypothetical protein